MIEKKLSYDVISIGNSLPKIDTIDVKLKVNDHKGIYNIHRAFTHQLKNKQQKNANTKTRSEVRGGGKKPWKQKGSGRARAGSSRSPLWKGGGVIFGPKPKQLKIKINKKEKKLALKHILYNKFQNTFVINNLIDKIDKPKTKSILSTIENLKIKLDTKILIIAKHKNRNLYLSTRNLPNIKLINADNLNITALLEAEILIVTASALEKINEVYNG